MEFLCGFIFSFGFLWGRLLPLVRRLLPLVRCFANAVLPEIWPLGLGGFQQEKGTQILRTFPTIQ